MKKYQFDDFNDSNAWLIFRMDAFIQFEPVDIYMVMDLPSGRILAFVIAETELSQEEVESLIKKALFQTGQAPNQILLANNDPIESPLKKAANYLQMTVKPVPAQSLEDLTDDVKRSYAKTPFSSTAMRNDDFTNDVDKEDYECAKRSLPDSYDLCSCASGLKYKFCCKRILRETVNAMVAAEDGDFAEALEWIGKARELVGNTSEVLCRESIVYSFIDSKKSEESLKKCLAANPKHPRAHYLQAITLTEQGNYQGAIHAYEKAISYYPATDRYHLNEAHNNLGIVYYKMGNLDKAKTEWEIALQYLPSDRIARRNLEDFIYSKK